MKYKKIFKNIILIIFSFCFLTSPAEALFLKGDEYTSQIKVGQETMLKIFIDTEEAEINALEGSLKINGEVDILAINTGGSIFSLWPEAPQLKEKNVINFIGGVEGGVYGNNLRLFNILIKSEKLNIITFETLDLKAYLNDGEGTKVDGQIKDFQIKIVSEFDFPEMNAEILKDKNIPFSFEISLGQDPSILDGQYFITFYAQDSESGIKSYAVKEGKGEYIDSGNIYVLKDQSLKTNIWVKAIDYAGNERIEQIIFSTQKNTLSLVLRIASILILIIIIFSILLNRLIKNRK